MNIAEQKAQLINGLSGSQASARRLKYNMYLRYGDIAQAIYSDRSKEGLIRGNPEAFIVLADDTISKWAFINKIRCEDFKAAEVIYPELKRLFTNLQELQKGMSKLEEWTGKRKRDVSYEEFVRGLSSFKADSIIPLLDDMEKIDEDIDLEIEDTGYFVENEEIDNEQPINKEMEHGIGVKNVNSIDYVTLNRQIAEAEADLTSGQLDAESEQAVRILINELKQFKDEELSGTKETLEVKDEYAGGRTESINILREIGASFEFTRREIKALEKAFASVNYNIKEDEEFALTNFVAVRRADFSATFIFSTLGLIKSKRKLIRDVFLAHTGYDSFGEIDNAPYNRQDWWAIECITKNKKFTVAEWPGTALPEYKDLGNLKKIWVGSSLREKHLTMDWLDAQNSFNLIGGKSRSGKTCLSHSLLIQGICGGVLPTFLDWKPEGSDLYKELGFFAVQRDARAWLPQGMQQGLHLLNILDALAWLKSMSFVWSNREIAGKRDFDKNKLATPDDPSLLFVFDEIAAFIGTVGSIRIGKKSEKDMTPQEKAIKTVTDFAESTFKGLNACLAACATYGVKFMGITQDIMMSDTVWSDKAWGGDEGKNFRKKMLNTFWGRGTVRGIDCPITEQKERSYVNMGMGRFGFEQNGVGTTFRALRIDNSENPSFPGMDAKAVLTNCLNAVGKGLPENRYSYFSALLNSVKSTPEFQAIIAAVHKGFCGVGTGEIENKYNSGTFVNEFNSYEDKKAPAENKSSYKIANIKPDTGSTMFNDLQAKRIVNDKQLEIERKAREAFESSIEMQKVDGKTGVNVKDTSNLGDMSDEEIMKAINDTAMGIEDIYPVIVENNNQPATSMKGVNGRLSILDTTKINNYSKLNNENSIDCRNAGAGSLSWIEKIMLNTPIGAERYIKKIWNSIIDCILSRGYKRAHITRVSIYGGQLYINGKIVNLNGVVGGFECIRLKDMVSFRSLFKKFFMIRELRIDEEMLNVAVMEFGDNAIEQLFKMAQKLEFIYIQTENSEVIGINRLSVQRLSTKQLVEKSKMSNDMDLHCINHSNKKWKQRAAGENIWGWKLAKSSISMAGKMFMAKNNPSVGKAAIYAGVGFLAGTIGGVAYGTVRLARGISNLVNLFKK